MKLSLLVASAFVLLSAACSTTTGDDNAASSDSSLTSRSACEADCTSSANICVNIAEHYWQDDSYYCVAKDLADGDDCYSSEQCRSGRCEGRACVGNGDGGSSGGSNTHPMQDWSCTFVPYVHSSSFTVQVNTWQEAERIATFQCEDAGNTDCSVSCESNVARTQFDCYYSAHGPRQSVSEETYTREEAESLAKRACGSYCIEAECH